MLACILYPYFEHAMETHGKNKWEDQLRETVFQKYIKGFFLKCISRIHRSSEYFWV